MSQLSFRNDAGVKWIISKSTEGYAFGQILVNDRPIESPFDKGFLGLRKMDTGELRWISASELTQSDETGAVFSGQANIDTINLNFTIQVALPNGVKAARMEYSFSVDRQLSGWEVIFAYHTDYQDRWTAHLYPIAQDAKVIAASKLTYIGVPSALLYRDDFSLAMLFGFDLEFDYLNPTTWSGDTGFYFTDNVIPAHFRMGLDSLEPGTSITVPLQLIFSDAGSNVKAIPDLVRQWIDLNKFEIEPLYVRTADEALDLFLRGRRATSMWKSGMGYKLEEGDPESDFIYLGEQPLSAYFEYLIYEKTGDPEWRQRCFEQMDFLLKAQNTNPTHCHYGAIHTAYDLPKTAFDSDDRGVNIGYKPDLNAYMARYMLQTWERVKMHEGIDRQDWYISATLAADWVMRHINLDGGLPQKVDEDTGGKSISVPSGRALPAMPVIYKITGDERYREFASRLEQYVRKDPERNLIFTGHHPDLPPDEIEEASIWGVVEYWLDKYDRMGDTEYLERAIADAYLSFLWWCPKQLSWVDNPTQCASAEQQHFLQYSIYCYQNRKLQCLHRLWGFTRNRLFKELYDRILQGIFWTQEVEGDLVGATHERIADPWLARSDYDEPPSFNSLGTIYMGEQSLDTMLQLVEMGVAKPREVKSCHSANPASDVGS